MERNDILTNYQTWITTRWSKGRLRLGEVLENIQALKVYTEVHQLTLEEHEAVVDQAGLDRRELIDGENLPLADWIAARRKPLAPGSGGLRFALPPHGSPWKGRLPAPPRPAHNWLAALAAAGLLISILVLISIITALI